MPHARRFGLFYGGHGQLLLVQIIECLVIASWTCAMMGTFFYSLRQVHDIPTYRTREATPHSTSLSDTTPALTHI